MKHKILSLVLALFMVIPCAFMLSACKEQSNDPTTVYTVTEDEWKVNFNLTKSQVTPLSSGLSSGKTAQLFSSNSQPLQAITSYTINAVGENYGQHGSCTLKVAPNAMSIEFYLDGVLRDDESGITPSSDPFYVGLTSSVMSYFPFENNYNDFTFDQTKRAYVAQNFTVYVVNESNINETYPLHTKSAEVTFINGYLNTIAIELASDTTFAQIYSSFVFTFSNINKTTVVG